ncbi:hypothetical protein [Gilvimarinus sp. 1_MG-2023]|uniref:hypothetical protein n=1 Tax=Gilvimarinus sp. 1_MG-2023 TaxID=3062638 RepID=UPI0026E3030C|nr:hypothetical protein [Gilvimarinus sp. 1_MG-2023]MDO6746301.1 hypothetical protein [Gilvimarinus sp. 1_MG-2023]
MIAIISDSFRWLWSLGGKFLRVAPAPTLFVILATLVSQVAMLLASLLPLKVLILIGSERVPRYFPQSFLQFDRDVLILSLCVAAPTFYLTHLAMEKFITWASNIGAKRLLAQGQKIVLFENQDDLAASSYRRYAGALANTVFIVCVWTTLGIIFPSLCLLVMSYTALCITGIGLAHRSSEALRERINENLTSVVPVLTALGFLLAFFFLVLEFLFGVVQGFIIAIISLLITRQAFNRTNRLVSAIVNLYDSRRKLNALFFKGHSLAQADEKQMEFWSLFMPQSREKWVRQILLEQLAIDAERLSINWHQTGLNEIVALEIDAHNNKDELLSRYLVRLYGKSPSLLATHEATLLFDESSDYLPALPLLAAGQLSKWQYHLFSLPDESVNIAPGKLTESYLTTLWAFEPPEDLAARYARSHPMLWQRLDKTVIERLYIAANEESRPLVSSLEEQLPDMLETVRNLPLVVVNPTINANTLMQDGEGELQVTFWGRWTLEPLGSGWPISRKSIEFLPNALLQAANQRPALQSIEVQSVALAALLFKFDSLCNNQLYQDALALIPYLLDTDQLDTVMNELS